MNISTVRIEGFRNLKNTSIGKLGPINIFYGENNAGKSNILAAIETVFKVEYPERRESLVAGFLHSELSSFIDNFTIGNDGNPVKIIKIVSRIGLDENDLKVLPVFLSFIKKQGIWQNHPYQWIELIVQVEPTGNTTATKQLKIVKVNGNILYDATLPSNQMFFPNHSSIPITERQAASEQLLVSFVNSVAIVKAERFLHEELLSASIVGNASPEQFKNWILNLSRSRGDDYRKLLTIIERFNGDEFKYGIIRPIVEGDKVGIVVKDSVGRELLIDRLGNGSQQILVLLANLVDTNARIVGIEEIETNLSPGLQNNILAMLKKTVGKSGIDQIFLTSHSQHLSTRNDVMLYAVECDANGTCVSWGKNAVVKLRNHFDFGLMKIPKRDIWR